MTKKTVLGAAIATAVATGTIKGYQLLGQRYGHLLPPKEQYQLPRDAQPVTVHTSIGDFRLVAASGYYGGTGIFVYAKNLVDPDAFNQKVLRGNSLARTQIVPVVTEELTAAFHKATNGQFHLDIPPHTSSGGDSNAFALITAGIRHDSYLKHHGQNPFWMLYDNNYEDGPTTEELDARFEALPSFSGYFKSSNAPTMRVAAHTLRTIIDGSLGDRTKSDLRLIAEGSLPVHAVHDLHKAKVTTEELVRYYKGRALDSYSTLKVRLAELTSKN